MFFWGLGLFSTARAEPVLVRSYLILASEILERFAYLFFIAMLSFMPHPERLS